MISHAPPSRVRLRFSNGWCETPPRAKFLPMSAESDAAAVLEQISRYHMPFGMFGPKNYPPRGVPIYDLPAEYLAWFALKGFPEGKLGELLRIVYQTKADGCDGVFDAIRRHAGGRYPLRPKPRRGWSFD
jgi:uncharacterized protein